MTPVEIMAAGLAELDRLDAAGLNESPEADAVRDRLDSVWPKLTPAEADEAHRLALLMGAEL